MFINSTSTYIASLAELQRRTGLAYKTIAARLEGVEPVDQTGREKLYDVFVALKAIWSPKEGARLDLSEARARQANRAADKLELEIAKMKGDMVNADDFIRDYETMVVSFRDSLHSFPMLVAAEVANIDEEKIVRKILQRRVNDALERLAEGENAATS